MAKNITLMGADYADVPAITVPKTGGGTARFDDASVTTAVESDVAAGKIFLLADGTIGTGTNEGGGGGALPTEVILPEQTVTVSGESTLLSGNTEQLVTGTVYLLTVNGVSKITTAEDIYSGASAIFLYYVRFEAAYGNELYLTVYQESLYGTYTVKIEKVLGLEYATLTTKTITENGTYSASDDSADGYSQVTVNVPSQAGAAMNTQVAHGVDRVATTSYTAVNGQSITVEVTGTYDIYWTGFRSSTSGTNGSQLYIDNVAYGTAQTKLIDELEKEFKGKKVKFTDEQREAYKTVGGTPFLDNDYTVFGEVIDGLEIIDEIAKVKTDRGDRPEDDLKMTVTVE